MTEEGKVTMNCREYVRLGAGCLVLALPKPLLAKIHAEAVAFVKSPDLRKRVEGDGAEPIGSDPEAFREFMLADLKKWADVVKRSGAKFE